VRGLTSVELHQEWIEDKHHWEMKVALHQVWAAEKHGRVAALNECEAIANDL